MKIIKGCRVVFLAGVLFFVLGTSAARSAAQAGGGTAPQAPATPAPDKGKTEDPSLILSGAPAAPSTAVVPPEDPKEKAAVTAFTAEPMTDLPTKIRMGEAFVLQYPNNPDDDERVYSALTYCYLLTGDAKKVRETGEKAIALNSNDVNALAMMAMTIPRAIDPDDKDPHKTLATAETYAKRAISLMPTVAKPAGVADQDFLNSQNQLLSMAHDGLGLVYYRLGRYADAVPELEASLKLVADPDTVTLFILGNANVKLSRFDDAASAFTRCVSVPGPMQDRCKAALEQAKKSAATQLNAPK